MSDFTKSITRVRGGAEPLRPMNQSGNLSQICLIELGDHTAQWQTFDDTVLSGPTCGRGIERLSVPRSVVRAAYATDTYYQPERAPPLCLSGAAQLRIVPTIEEGFVSDAAMRAALRSLLVVIDPVFVGVPVVVDGVGFPSLAFAEFMQSLIMWPVLVQRDGVAGAAVDIEECAFFDVPPEYRDLIAALLTGDHAGFFVGIDQHFDDSPYALLRQTRNPGRVEFFLNEARRSYQTVKA